MFLQWSLLKNAFPGCLINFKSLLVFYSYLFFFWTQRWYGRSKSLGFDSLSIFEKPMLNFQSRSLQDKYVELVFPKLHLRCTNISIYLITSHMVSIPSLYSLVQVASILYTIIFSAQFYRWILYKLARSNFCGSPWWILFQNFLRFICSVIIKNIT